MTAGDLLGDRPSLRPVPTHRFAWVRGTSTPASLRPRPPAPEPLPTLARGPATWALAEVLSAERSTLHPRVVAPPATPIRDEGVVLVDGTPARPSLAPPDAPALRPPTPAALAEGAPRLVEAPASPAPRSRAKPLPSVSVTIGTVRIVPARPRPGAGSRYGLAPGERVEEDR